MKPQDVVVAAHLFISNPEEEISVRAQSATLKISLGDITNSRRRLAEANILEPKSNNVLKVNFLEFLVHGLKYTFPIELSAPARGIPTAWAHPHFKKNLVSREDPVWPSIHGDVYGPALAPLYKSLPDACMQDERLYLVATAIDCLRAGRSREMKLAMETIENLKRGHL